MDEQEKLQGDIGDLKKWLVKLTQQLLAAKKARRKAAKDLIKSKDMVYGLTFDSLNAGRTLPARPQEVAPGRRRRSRNSRVRA